IAVTPTSPLSSQVVTFSWDDVNIGNGPTKNSWHDYVTLVRKSDGSTVAPAQTVFYNAASGGAVAAGDQRALQASFTLPDGPTGTGDMTVVVTTNYLGEVFEHNGTDAAAQSNNATALAFHASLAPYPDLTVSGVQAPA